MSNCLFPSFRMLLSEWLMIPFKLNELAWIFLLQNGNKEWGRKWTITLSFVLSEREKSATKEAISILEKVLFLYFVKSSPCHAFWPSWLYLIRLSENGRLPILVVWSNNSGDLYLIHYSCLGNDLGTLYLNLEALTQ